MFFLKKGAASENNCKKKLKEIGRWKEIVQLDSDTLNKIILEHKWGNSETKGILPYLTLEVNKRVHLSKFKRDK